MSQIDHEEDVLSETNAKLVPVSEAIRYRKRAQTAEKENEILAEELADTKAERDQMAEQLSDVESERELIHKLASAGAVDMETAVLVAKVRLESDSEIDLDGCIEQLKKQKRYLFESGSKAVGARRSSPAKEHESHSRSLESAAKRAATSGSRTDLQEYLRLRRNFV